MSILNLFARLATGWLLRDSALFCIMFAAAAPLTIALFALTPLSTPDIAMTVATPLVSLYMISRSLSVWQAHHPVPDPAPLRLPFERACVGFGGASLMLLFVSAASWVVYGVFGPGEARPMAAGLSAIAVTLLLLTLGCLALQKPLADGHRLLVRPVLYLCEVELVRSIARVRARFFSARSSLVELLSHHF